MMVCGFEISVMIYDPIFMNVIYKVFVFSSLLGVFCDIVEDLPEACLENNLLDLWDFNEDTIKQLTKQDILNAVNTVKKSTLSRGDYSTLLGKVHPWFTSCYMIQSHKVSTFF